MSYHFAGFYEPNYTPIPDAFFDEVMVNLSEAELRAALYILRRTFGFKKRADTISFNQFLRGIRTKDQKQLDYGCGLASPTTLSAALTGLEEKGLITRVRTADASGAKRTTQYLLRFQEHPLREPYEGTTDGVAGYHAEDSSGVLRQPEIQETVIQETENNNTGNNKVAARARRSKSLSGRYYDLVHH